MNLISKGIGNYLYQLVKNSQGQGRGKASRPVIPRHLYVLYFSARNLGIAAYT